MPLNFKVAAADKGRGRRVVQFSQKLCLKRKRKARHVSKSPSGIMEGRGVGV